MAIGYVVVGNTQTGNTECWKLWKFDTPSGQFLGEQSGCGYAPYLNFGLSDALLQLGISANLIIPMPPNAWGYPGGPGAPFNLSVVATGEDGQTITGIIPGQEYVSLEVFNNAPFNLKYTSTSQPVTLHATDINKFLEAHSLSAVSKNLEASIQNDPKITNETGLQNWHVYGTDFSPGNSLTGDSWSTSTPNGGIPYGIMRQIDTRNMDLTKPVILEFVLTQSLNAAEKFPDYWPRINILDSSGKIVKTFFAELQSAMQGPLEISQYLKNTTLAQVQILGIGEIQSILRSTIAISSVKLSYARISDIPKITIVNQLKNSEFATWQSFKSHIVGKISVSSDIAVPIILDTHGLTNPSKITIQDPSIITDIPVDVTMDGDIQTLPFDIYLVNPISYFIQHQDLKLDFVLTDLKPVINILGFKDYVQLVGDNFVGTVRCTFQVDNSKYGYPIQVQGSLNYFGVSKASFQVPAFSILIASFDHGYIGSVNAVKETGGGATVSAGVVSQGGMFDTPTLGFEESLPPALPAPNITLVPSTPGSIQPPPEGTSGSTSQAIVLSKGEKIVLVVGGVSALALGVAAALLRKPHRSHGT